MVAPMEELLEAIITQTVVDEADNQSNVGMEDPGVEEVSLAPMAAMITQNPNSQESESVSCSCITQNVVVEAVSQEKVSSADPGAVAEESLVAMASIFSHFYPSTEESQSVICFLILKF
jgi:hypothetical protein